MIRLPIFILLWAGFLAIKIPTIILGIFVVPILWKYRNTLYDDLPWWSRPWSNPEDWRGGAGDKRDGNIENSLPKWWAVSRGSDFKSFWHYHAIRNPANGLRSFEWIDLDIDPDKVEYITNGYLEHYEPRILRPYNENNPDNQVKTAWYIAWQGFQAGVKYVHLWNDEYTKIVKKLENIGPAWQLFTFWKWTQVEVEKTFSARHLVFKFGWRVQPSDAVIGPNPDGIRGKDSGFATKLLVHRKG